MLTVLGLVTTLAIITGPNKIAAAAVAAPNGFVSAIVPAPNKPAVDANVPVIAPYSLDLITNSPILLMIVTGKQTH